MGFADAEYECQAQKVPSHLTSIHGTKENAQILSLMKNVTSEKSWIGLTEQPSNGWVRVRTLCLKMVYGHLQQPGFCGPPKFRSFAAKPFAAVICSNHLQQK